MNAALTQRGPDDEGYFSDAQAVIGMRRLSIIDLAGGHQPVHNEDETVQCVFNGEIYNYRELRAELVAAGHRFRTLTDSEVLLHLYERDGFGMLARLNGIFAFAIHDARPAGRPEGMPCGGLFLARDQLGVKPLYYAHTAQGFLFASEIKALICDAGLSRAIDAQALHYTLAYLWTPAPRTMLADVRKLEPGAALLVMVLIDISEATSLLSTAYAVLRLTQTLYGFIERTANAGGLISLKLKAVAQP